MATYRTKTEFKLVTKLLEDAIAAYSIANVKDAHALTDREDGMHNLQGHARTVIPLAVWIAFKEPSLLPLIRKRTDLKVGMTAHSTEARDSLVWSPVKKAIKKHVKSSGDDVVANKPKANSPATAAEILATYLGDDYGGGQTSGGAGNTVLKRSLKILAHTLPT